MTDHRDEPSASYTLKRLERELEAERRDAAELRAGVHSLQHTVAELRAEFAAQIREAESKAEQAERRLRRQSDGHDASSDELELLREELARVASERDALQQRLARIEGMQTETVALPDDAPDPSPAAEDTPSIDELMASLGEMLEDNGRKDAPDALDQAAIDADWQEMLAPELIAPEAFEASSDLENAEADADAATMRGQLLVLLDADRPIKYPIYKDVMTIGRSDSADIQVDGNFISRIHARVVRRESGIEIQDAGSKNGLKVNAQRVDRRMLAHGDVLGIGVLRFTYVETATTEA